MTTESLGLSVAMLGALRFLIWLEQADNSDAKSGSCLCDELSCENSSELEVNDVLAMDNALLLLGPVTAAQLL